MKLLFDQNLSPKLVKRLADLYPGAAHLDPLGMGQADDTVVWNYAKANDFAIVTKDEDYDLLGVAWGHPPKVIWLQLGNCTTNQVEAAIRSHTIDIQAFEQDASVGTLVIS